MCKRCQNVFIFYVLIIGGREGVKANKSNVFEYSLYFFVRLPSVISSHKIPLLPAKNIVTFEIFLLPFCGNIGLCSNFKKAAFACQNSSNVFCSDFVSEIDLLLVFNCSSWCWYNCLLASRNCWFISFWICTSGTWYFSKKLWKFLIILN